MPGFPSKYSPELWQQARDLIAAGMTFPEVSDKTGIGLDNLYKKSSRENWTVPATILKEAQKTVALRELESQVSVSVQTEAILAENVAEMGQKGALAVVRGLLPKIQQTFREESALLAKEITTWKDAGQAFGIFAKASGLDKPTQAVQVNLWTQGNGAHQTGDGP